MFLSVPLIAIGLAACGGSSNNNSGGSSTAAGTAVAQTTASTDTVATKSVSGVGNRARRLEGQRCSTPTTRTAAPRSRAPAQCTSIWLPLMAPSGGQPTLIRLGRAGEARRQSNGQVTFGGKPLYTFVQDSPGQATGNGVNGQLRRHVVHLDRSDERRCGRELPPRARAPPAPRAVRPADPRAATATSRAPTARPRSSPRHSRRRARP